MDLIHCKTYFATNLINEMIIHIIIGNHELYRNNLLSELVHSGQHLLVTYHRLKFYGNCNAHGVNSMVSNSDHICRIPINV